jgi:ribosome-associated toxin RatA of RatAB toxin-antitoxin module
MALMLTATVLALALAADLPPSAVQSGLTADEYAQASSGEVVVKGEIYKTADGKDAARGKAWLVIGASQDACWDTLYRYEEGPQFLPRLKKVTIKTKTPQKMDMEQDIKIVLSTYHYGLNFVLDKPKYTATWALDPTVKNDIKDTTGAWIFKPLPDGKTLLEYAVTVDSGLAVPSFMTDYLTKRDLPEILLSFKRRVESGGKWTKD